MISLFQWKTARDQLKDSLAENALRYGLGVPSRKQEGTFVYPEMICEAREKYLEWSKVFRPKLPK